MADVLVGIITYDGGRYCRDTLFKYLKALKTPVSYCFVTNSGPDDRNDLEERAKELPGTAAVLETDDIGDPKAQVVKNRNAVREYFLAGEWQRLFFLDHDLVGPTNAIDVLLNDKKSLVTGWYLAAFNHDGKSRVLPLAYIRDAPGRSRQLSIKDVLIPRILNVTCAGLGCTLIDRSILERVDFRTGEGTEDAVFYKRVRDEAGEELYLDTRVSYWHLKFTPGDKRNALLDPRRYQLKKKQL